jgi:hypothetical protein
MARSKKSDWGMDSGLGSDTASPQRLIRVKGHIVICVVSISGLRTVRIWFPDDHYSHSPGSPYFSSNKPMVEPTVVSIAEERWCIGLISYYSVAFAIAGLRLSSYFAGTFTLTLTFTTTERLRMRQRQCMVMGVV